MTLASNDRTPSVAPLALDDPRRFVAVAEVVQNRPGTWNSEKIHILDRSQLDPAGQPIEIGSYVRNYADRQARTFAPFMRDGEWYALYSKHYTATRVMRLPSMEDVGGEEPHAAGFCPVELWVPRHTQKPLRCHDGSTIPLLNWHQPHEDDDPEDQEAISWHWSPVAFVAGCHWGDDSSWKIEAFDLREVAQGRLRRFQPLGYVHMGGDTLSESIDLEMLRADGTGRLRIRTISTLDIEWPKSPESD